MKQGDVVAQRYELVELASVGGMSEVFRALDRQTGAAVALKLMAEGEDRARFARESTRLRSVTHPGVVRLLEIGETAERPFLIMEWIDGDPLERRLERTGLTVRESIVLGRRLAETLGALHDAGLIHRDLKPSNVLLEGGDIARAKLIDFGVARALDDSMVLTVSGMLIGTPEYMAPEQASGARDLDARCDVFSLGCVLYECVTGIPAFAGENSAAIRAKLLSAVPRMSRAMCPEMPDALAELIQRMLAKSREHRPRDGNAVAAALATIVAADGPRRPTREVEDSTAELRSGDKPANASPPSVVRELRERARVPVRYCLVVLERGLEATHWLPADGSAVIGRAETADIRIEHGSISGRHVRVHCGRALTVEDLGSRNGTRVRFKAIAPNEAVTVMPGEMLHIGTVLATVSRSV